MQTILVVMGTRPEVIKMAPVISELKKFKDKFRSVICVTGQHRDLLDQALDVFSLQPDFDLNVMAPNQSLSMLTANLLQSLEGIVEKIQPDWILAQGDTTSVLAASLLAFYNRIKFGHIEAGLRTSNFHHPFPEEFNRRIADLTATVWFAPTTGAKKVLLAEGCPEKDIVLTGNTVVDALQSISKRNYDWSKGPLSVIPGGKKYILVTVHRRENFGEPLLRICAALKQLAAELVIEKTHIVCLMHPNPGVRNTIDSMLSGIKNITLLDPLDYVALVHLMRHSKLVLTDSGGLQEEAPSLGVPVLILRETTERPEGVEAGIAKIIGTKREKIVKTTMEILKNPKQYSSMVAKVNPYGDGRAAKRIVATLLGYSKQ